MSSLGQQAAISLEFTSSCAQSSFEQDGEMFDNAGRIYGGEWCRGSAIRPRTRGVRRRDGFHDGRRCAGRKSGSLLRSR